MPSSTIPKIQLAIQGGGAKVFPLLAALDALQSLVREGRVVVTRVAGTSAGAVAGSLFASGLNLGEVRHEIELLSKQIIHDFGSPGVWSWLWLITRGRPLWLQKRLDETLTQLLARNGVVKISDVKKKTGIELVIVSTDLNQGAQVIHTQNEDVVPAILDSCGIPFCFRTWSGHGANRVDGAIVENLPVEALVSDAKTHGPVIAISFDRIRPKAPQSVTQFSLALLSAAMDNSVDRALRRVGAENIFSIACPYGTFDFETALERGFQELYDLIKLKAKLFFEAYIDPDEMTVGDPWESGDIANMLRIGEMYSKQHRDVPIEHLRTRLDITANSLTRTSVPDIIDYSTSIKAVTSPIFCHAIAMSSAEHKPSIERTQISIFNEDTRERVETIRVYMRDPARPLLRFVLLCFVPPLLPGMGPYTIRIIDSVQGAMKPLAEKRADEMRLTPTRAKGKLGRVEMIIRVPEQFDSTSIQNKANERWGSRMTDWELKDSQSPGFRSLGWTGVNLDPTVSWAVDVLLH